MLAFIQWRVSSDKLCFGIKLSSPWLVMLYAKDVYLGFTDEDWTAATGSNRCNMRVAHSLTHCLATCAAGALMGLIGAIAVTPTTFLLPPTPMDQI
jgi:hypothetical protein